MRRRLGHGRNPPIGAAAVASNPTAAPRLLGSRPSQVGCPFFSVTTGFHCRVLQITASPDRLRVPDRRLPLRGSSAPQLPLHCRKVSALGPASFERGRAHGPPPRAVAAEHRRPEPP